MDIAAREHVNMLSDEVAEQLRPISIIKCAVIRNSADRLDKFRIQSSLLPSVDGC